MKSFIISLKEDRHVYIFVILGIILIAFPDAVGHAAPYLLGIGALAYGAVSILINLKTPDSSASLGGGVVFCVAGVVVLTMKGDSIGVLGVIWAMITLYEVAMEIDESRKTKKISPLSLISIIISIFLAVLLISDPFAHFITHVRILGIEMIAAAFVRRKRRVKENASDTE